MDKKKNVDEQMESWISLAYAIDAGVASLEDYPKDFRDWYEDRKGKKKGDAYRNRTKKLIAEQQKVK